MLDFTRRARLAGADLGRRAGLLAGAGLLAAIAGGFLLAALWSYLAHGLHWGPAAASLALALLCLLGAAVLGLLGRARRHAMPTPADLGRELRARGVLATESVMAALRHRVALGGETARQRVFGIGDRARHGVDAAADRLDAAAARMAGKVSGADPAQSAAPGLDPAALAAGLTAAREGAGRFVRTSPVLALASAFAVGLVLAGAVAPADDEDDEDGDALP